MVKELGPLFEPFKVRTHRRLYGTKSAWQDSPTVFIFDTFRCNQLRVADITAYTATSSGSCVEK